jgi:hypothetical protein
MKHIVAAGLIGLLAYAIAAFAIPDETLVVPVRTILILALGLVAYASGMQFARPPSRVSNDGKETKAPDKPQVSAKEKPASAKVVAAPARSEALNLLAAMQREARFVDFIREPLDGYSDAQIGAAARTVHRDCGGF